MSRPTKSVTSIEAFELKSSIELAYKFMQENCKWTQHLYYVKQMGNGMFLFKPNEDNESTPDVHIARIYIAIRNALLKIRNFKLNASTHRWDEIDHKHPHCKRRPEAVSINRNRFRPRDSGRSILFGVQTCEVKVSRPASVAY